MIRCLFPFALVLGGCGAAAETVDPKSVAYGKVKIETAQVPARFAAAWPSSREALKNWYEETTGLPINHAIDGLLAGDSSLYERLSAASKRVSESERDAWVRQMRRHLDFKTVRPEFCTPARPTMAGAASTLREVIAPSFVKSCLRPEDRAMVLREDTPPKAVIGYFVADGRYDDPPLPFYDPRFEQAVRAEIATSAEAYQKEQASFALTRHPDPRAEAALMQLYREAKTTEEKIGLGRQLRRGNSAEAKAIGASICKEYAAHAICVRERESREQTARMRAQGITVYSSDDPVPEDVEPDPEPRRDPPAKVRAMIDQMIAMGFTALASHDPAKTSVADPSVIFSDAGLLYAFDVETGMYPNAHDSLMRELAALTGDAFAGAVFDEIPPVFKENARPDEAEESGPYRISVYQSGKRYRIDAQNLGDWYDLDAVLSLMNAVLADRQSPLRLDVLGGEGQTAMVVAATPAAYAKAVKARLLNMGKAGEAANLGKAYEAQALETLKKAK